MSNPPIVAGNLKQSILPDVKPGRLSAGEGWMAVTIAGMLLLLGAMALVSLVARAPNAGFANSATALAAITAATVGIERVLEVFWTAIGMTLGSFWPLTRVHELMQRFTARLDTELEPVYKQAKQAIGQVSQTEQWGEQRITLAEKEIEDIKKSLLQFQNLAPNSQHVNFMIAAATRAIGDIEAKYPSISTTTQAAKQVIAITSDILDSFKDNPGRRLISIYLGAILGLAVAGLTGMDVFQATGTAPTAGATLFPGIGVALTGLMMGLGSNPTHELIRTLQEIKKSRKAENDSN